MSMKHVPENMPKFLYIKHDVDINILNFILSYEKLITCFIRYKMEKTQLPLKLIDHICFCICFKMFLHCFLK